MRSDVPKVLHRVAGRTLVEWVVDAAREAGAERVVAVVRPGDGVAEGLPEGVEVVEQTRGRGHRRRRCSPRASVLERRARSLVLSGDQPLITAEQLEGLLAEHDERAQWPRFSPPSGSTRPASGGSFATAKGHVERIFETKHPDGLSKEELAVREINLGTYVFDADTLFEALDQVGLEQRRALPHRRVPGHPRERRHRRRARDRRRRRRHRRERPRRPHGRPRRPLSAASSRSTPARASRSCSRAQPGWRQG